MQNLFLTGQEEQHKPVPDSCILSECEAVMFVNWLSRSKAYLIDTVSWQGSGQVQLWLWG